MFILRHLILCYKGLCNKYEKVEGERFSIDNAAYFLHSIHHTTSSSRRVLAASLYAAFASLLHNKHNTLAGQRVIMFSYASGSTAAMFSLKLNEGQHPFSLSNIATMMNVAERLQKRYEYTPREFDIFVGLYEARKEFGIKNDYWCEMPGSILPPGAYYFRGVDSEYRRAYGKKTPDRR